MKLKGSRHDLNIAKHFRADPSYQLRIRHVQARSARESIVSSPRLLLVPTSPRGKLPKPYERSSSSVVSNILRAKFYHDWLLLIVSLSSEGRNQHRSCRYKFLFRFFLLFSARFWKETTLRLPQGHSVGTCCSTPAFGDILACRRLVSITSALSCIVQCPFS